jgi:1,2-diacylglycerol 3-alpha-glucosyltransferase
MKVLITTECYIPTINGVVVSTMNLKNELIKRGHEVKILTLSETRHSYEKDGDIYIGSAGALVYPGARFTFPRNNKYIEEIICWKPDIIHTQSEFSTFILAKQIAKRLNIPIIHTYHTIYEDYTHYFSPVKKWGKAFARAFTNAILKNVQAVIAPSEKVKILLNGYGYDGNLKVIPTGIALETNKYQRETSNREKLRKQLDISKDYKVLISVGRLAKEKNHEEILEFFKKQNKNDKKLVIVGDGPNRSELESYACELGINGDVIFTGMIPHENVNQYYQLGDVFVSASNSETQGLTYFEALANGVPVICRKDDCLTDIVIDGVNGWQYENFKEFDKYLDLALNLSDDLSGTIQESIKSKYSLETFAEKVEGFYYETIINFAKVHHTEFSVKRIAFKRSGISD